MDTDITSLSPDAGAVCHIGLVHGLSTRADLNGRLARAVRFVPSKGRWALIMDGGEKVLVRDENIDFEAPEAIEADGMLPVVGKPVVSQPAVLVAAPVAPPPPIVAWFANAMRCFCIPIAKPEPQALQ